MSVWTPWRRKTSGSDDEQAALLRENNALLRKFLEASGVKGLPPKTPLSAPPPRKRTETDIQIIGRPEIATEQAKQRESARLSRLNDAADPKPPSASPSSPPNAAR